MALQDALDSPLAKAVRKAGSQARYGDIVGKRQPTIHHALKHGHKIDLEDVPLLVRELGMTEHELRPDYFDPQNKPARRPAEHPPEPSPSPLLSEGSGGPHSGEDLAA